MLSGIYAECRCKYLDYYAELSVIMLTVVMLSTVTSNMSLLFEFRMLHSRRHAFASDKHSSLLPESAFSSQLTTHCLLFAFFGFKGEEKNISFLLNV
jgi:hypothetical protein